MRVSRVDRVGDARAARSRPRRARDASRLRARDLRQVAREVRRAEPRRRRLELRRPRVAPPNAVFVRRLGAVKPPRGGVARRHRPKHPGGGACAILFRVGPRFAEHELFGFLLLVRPRIFGCNRPKTVDVSARQRSLFHQTTRPSVHNARRRRLTKRRRKKPKHDGLRRPDSRRPRRRRSPPLAPRQQARRCVAPPRRLSTDRRPARMDRRGCPRVPRSAVSVADPASRFVRAIARTSEHVSSARFAPGDASEPELPGASARASPRAPAAHLSKLSSPPLTAPAPFSHSRQSAASARPP